MKYFILILTLASCSDARKLAKICERSPYLCDTTEVTRDTTYQVDTFATLDTSYITLPRDTIEIVNEKVFTRIVRDHDTLMVYQEIEPDTVIQIKEKQVIKYKTKRRPWWSWVSLIVQIGLGALLIRAIARR